MEDRLKTVVGFDRIDITPYVSKTRGTITPRLSVTKKLLGDRLYVTYSTTVETGEMQIWKLEYALNKNLSLIGSSGRGGASPDRAPGSTPLARKSHQPALP